MAVLFIALVLSIASISHVHADRTPDSPRWLAGTAIVAAALGGLLCWDAAHAADAAALERAYTQHLVPGLLTLAASAALPAVMASGHVAQVSRLLVGTMLFAAAGARLDARVLQLALAVDPAARAWFAERLVDTWAYRPVLDLIAAPAALAAVVSLPLRGRSLAAVAALGGLWLATAVQLDAAWGRLRDPAVVATIGEQALPVLEAQGTPLVSAGALSGGQVLAEAPGLRLRRVDLDGVRGVLVSLPGTEQLPAALRWTGWRVVPLAAPVAVGQPVVFGSAGQVWMQTPAELRALGTLAQAPGRLGIERGALVLQPGADWQVGDLAALCAASGCKLAPAAAALAVSP